MKNIILIIVLISLSACTQAKPVHLDETTADQNDLKAQDQSLDALKSSTGLEGAKTTSKNSSAQELQETITINEDLKNMNTVTLKTSMGEIKIKLDAENAPISADNFKKYVDSGFYKDTLFHRVIPGFMVQGGGFDLGGKQKETMAPIKNEATNGLKNKRGTLAMARTMVVDSATSQFFINLVDNDFLDYTDESNYGYAVFGEVVEGMDIVDEIAKVKTANNGGHQNWPVENVTIESASLSE